MNRFRFCVFVLLLGGSLAAHGASEERQSSWGKLLPALSITNDVRFNGMSLSNRKPALQGSLHWWRPDNYYAGIWLSQVDFQDAGGTSVEFDTYVGRNFYAGRTEYKVEVLYSAFDDGDVPGPTYDFLQFKVAATRTLESLSLGLAAQWSPAGSAGSGTVQQLKFDSSWRVNDNLKASAAAGRRWADNAEDRTYWDVGLTFEWKKLDFDIRYVDTNLDRSRCFYTDWCEGGVVTKLTLASY